MSSTNLNRTWIRVLALLVSWIGMGGQVLALAVVTRTSPMEQVSDTTAPTWWDRVKGVPASNRIMLGMWSLHVSTHGTWSQANDDNQMIAFTYGGYFAGTLLNSWGNRAWAAGIQRQVFERDAVSSPFKVILSYRLGLMRQNSAKNKACFVFVGRFKPEVKVLNKNNVIAWVRAWP